MKANSARNQVLVWSLVGALIFLSLLSLVYSFAAGPMAGRDVLTLAGDVLWGLLPVVFACLAGLILSRQPGNVIGWLLMLPAVALAADRFFGTYFGSFTSAPSHPSPAFLLALWFYGWSWLLLIFPVFFILQLFPAGKPLTARWRWFTVYTLAVCALFFTAIAFSQTLARDNIGWSLINPVGFISITWNQEYSPPIFGIGLISITLFSAASMFLRYRRAQAVERQQIKWLLFACGFFAAIYVSMFLSSLLNSSKEVWVAGVWYVVGPVALMTVPAAIAIAILRYRLWDIDVIIRRTLVYTLVTVLLALVYFGSVVLLQRLFGMVTGVEQSPLAVVVSTLVIAALFTPLRRRIQDALDRRFYRKKYNAQKVLAQFALAARDETDLDTLTTELEQVVQETMQPARVTVWLSRPPAARRQGDA